MRPYRRELFICLALCVLTVLVFGQIKGHEFIQFGAVDSLADTPVIRDGWSAEGVARALSGRLHQQWQPLAALSHMTAVELLGIDPGAHHLVNLFLHLANTLLLFLVLGRMTGALWQSAFAAALFALHPLHVEPVAWVAGRRELLLAFFFTLALWAYARYARRPGRRGFLLVLGPALLGAAASPLMISLPVVLLLLDYWPLARMPRPLKPQAPAAAGCAEVGMGRILLEKALLLGVLLMAGLAAARTVPALGSVDFYGSWVSAHQVAAALHAYVAYIQKTLWPTGLTLSYPLADSLPLWQAAAAGLFLAAVSAAVIRWGRSRPYLPVGWFWYLATVTPVVGLVPFGPERMADRYAYIPLVGLFVMAAWGIPELLERLRISRKWLAVAGGCALAACMITAQAQTARWKNGYVLFSHLVQGEPDDPRLYYSYGVAAMREENFAEAVRAFQEVIRLDPRNTAVRNQLGILLAQEGRGEEAKAHFEKGLQLGSRNSESTYNYGLLMMQQGNTREAQVQFEAALKANPENEGAHNALGVLLTEEKRYEDARRHFDEAIRIAPRRPEAEFNKGLAYMYEGRLEDAKEHYRRALAIDPDHAKAHLYLAKLLVRERDLEGAFTHFNEVLRINPGDPEAQHAVGLLHIERGNAEAARRHLEAALQLNPENGEIKRLLADLDKAANEPGRQGASGTAQAGVTPRDESRRQYEVGLAQVRDGRLDDAKKTFDAILKKSPRHAGAHYNLGVITARQKRLDEAVGHFRKALEITPEDGHVAPENPPTGPGDEPIRPDKA